MSSSEILCPGLFLTQMKGKPAILQAGPRLYPKIKDGDLTHLLAMGPREYDSNSHLTVVRKLPSSLGCETLVSNHDRWNNIGISHSAEGISLFAKGTMALLTSETFLVNDVKEESSQRRLTRTYTHKMYCQKVYCLCNTACPQVHTVVESAEVIAVTVLERAGSDKGTLGFLFAISLWCQCQHSRIFPEQ